MDSLHEALINVSTKHLLDLLHNQVLADSLILILNTDDKLFWYLGNIKKVNRIISTHIGSSLNKGELLKLKNELEQEYDKTYSKKRNKIQG